VQSEAAASSNNLVKIVGIIAGSLTVVAVAALLVFANQSDDADAEDSAIAADQGDRERLVERARTEQAAVEQAQASSIALEEAELRARKLRFETELLQAKAQASAGEEKADAPKPRARPRKKPKPKPKPKPGDSFEDL
jgi:outer membrane biosynthesis protein TonB